MTQQHAPLRPRNTAEPRSGRSSRAGWRAVVLIATIAGFAALFAGTASAHVKVSGPGATEGGYGVITFRVPSESATASTVALRITFPADAPFASVDTQPKAGWTASVTTKPLPKPVTNQDGATTTEYVAQVTYKATGSNKGIPPGQFDLFNLSVGPFPNQPTMTFEALQTYSDGTTVNWNERSADGVTEPEHPAPVLTLAPASTPSAATTAGVQVTAGSAGSTPWTAIIGLIIAAVALCVAVIAVGLARRPRHAGRPPE